MVTAVDPAVPVDALARLPLPPALRWRPYYTVTLLCLTALFISYLDRSNISVASIGMQRQFGWTETVKGIVLSSFFVGYMLLQVPSSTLANRYGGKRVLAAAVLWWSLCTVLTPLAALAGLPALIGIRIALGLGEAAVFPASINMIGRWVPPAVRSRAVATFTSGVYLGTVTSLPATGLLIRAHGWPMPFYVFGALGVVWATLWVKSVGSGRGVPEDSAASDTRHIPWRPLLREPAVWAVVIGHFCHNWLIYMLLAWLPSYFKATFGVSLTDAGLLSAAPWLVGFAMANLAGHLADWLIARGWSRTTVRKTLQAAGLLGGALFLLAMRGAGSPAVAALLMCGATAMLGLCAAGFACNAFDIAPDHADVIWGISNTVATLPGVVGIAVTGWLVDRTGSFTAPFLLAAGVAVAGAALYLALASGNRMVR